MLAAFFVFMSDLFKTIFLIDKAVSKTPEEHEQKDKIGVDQEQDANAANKDPKRPSNDFWNGRGV